MVRTLILCTIIITILLGYYFVAGAAVFYYVAVYNVSFELPLVAILLDAYYGGFLYWPYLTSGAIVLLYGSAFIKKKLLLYTNK